MRLSKKLLSVARMHAQATLPINRCFNSSRYYQIANIPKDIGKVSSTFQIPSLSALQSKTLEVVSKDNSKDVFIEAPIFSGKTLAYLVPTFELVSQAIKSERWAERPGFRALIVVPTREAAIAVGFQIDKYISSLPVEERPLAPVTKGNTDTYTFKSTKKEGHEIIEDHQGYSAYEKSITRRENVYGLSYAVICGGKSMEQEITMLDASEPEIIVATPGRLLDHMKNSDYFRNCKIVVVDDCQLFKGDVEGVMDKVFENIPQTTQRVFVGTAEPFKKYLRNSDNVELISSTESVSKSDVKQSIIKTQNTAESLKVLHQILSQNKHKKVAVFGENSQIIHTHYLMAENGIFSLLIASKIAPSRSLTSFSNFNQQQNGIAFCSNIACQMTPDVDLVIHLGAPETQEKYESRLSRTYSKNQSQSIVLASQIPDFLSNVQIVQTPSASSDFIAKQLRVPSIQKVNGENLLISLILRRQTTTPEEKKQAVEQAIKDLKDFGFVELPKLPKQQAIKLGFEKELLDAGLLE
ncbi:predicted protein [Naegleria gruberi]|uniref:ATP-dependent RNA helicase n=1 Tax=Naegleria gruberi TaxID=5762 RepID=D2VX91_NAEGR|nr:uncharacterized protein NAEGRDRAFT_73661 [Naegleria gruberi]EFC38586.1 predicted protein [Naegleria gruberi]|eukprot:XP_002671330.1 predicted protein [Naegleria gruberi strain NEG-M]